MRISTLRALAVAIALASPIVAVAASTTIPLQQAAPPPTRPDNTKVNKQDGPTADQQSQTKADLAISQKIRRTIVKDKTLSMTAHNCKVITQHGAVTLRGPVNSAAEKDTIGAIALKIAGEGNVTNELAVKPSK
jgi:osmotically-inducible protein OsmY